MTPSCESSTLSVSPTSSSPHPSLSSQKLTLISMKAWHSTLLPSSPTPAVSAIRFLADPSATFTAALDQSLTGKEELFGNVRSKRYAVTTRGGKVSGVFEEPDGTGVDVSKAEKVLG